jgi:hypothetical protein
MTVMSTSSVSPLRATRIVEPRSSVRNKRRRRGLAAGGQLRAPDRGLRLRLAREPPEQLCACGARLGLGAYAIEKRRALFLLPAFERIRHVRMARARRRCAP